METNFLNIAEDYATNFDFSIIRLQGKKPLENSISDWFKSFRTLEDLRKVNWNDEKITGIGVIVQNGLTVFDFDKVTDISIINLCLEELGLAADYKWLVKSGSGNGFHLYINVNEKGKLLASLGNSNIIYFKPRAESILDHVELRLSNCYLVLPPSTHPATKNNYEFVNGTPTIKPQEINADTLIDFLEKYFNTKEKKNKNKLKNNYDEKYLNDAIDFIKEKEFGYQTWIKLGFALASLGEKGRVYFIRLSKNKYWDTSDELINNEFNKCINGYNPKKSNLGTLFQYVIDKGFKYSFQKSGFSCIYFEFKLCLLQLPDDDLSSKIMNYAMFRKAIERNGLKGRKNIISFIKQNFKIDLSKQNYPELFNCYKELNLYTIKFEKNYGPDVICRIGKELFEDILNGKYKMIYFRVFAAIQGILGKEATYKQIGKMRIKFAIKGYKSEAIAKKSDEMACYLISDSTIKSIMKKLEGKGFFRKVTYGREAFYSTRLNKKELEASVLEYLKKRKRKYLERLDNSEFRQKTAKELRKIEWEFVENDPKSNNLYKLQTSKLTS